MFCRAIWKILAVRIVAELLAPVVRAFRTIGFIYSHRISSSILISIFHPAIHGYPVIQLPRKLSTYSPFYASRLSDNHSSLILANLLYPTTCLFYDIILFGKAKACQIFTRFIMVEGLPRDASNSCLLQQVHRSFFTTFTGDFRYIC